MITVQEQLKTRTKHQRWGNLTNLKYHLDNDLLPGYDPTNQLHTHIWKKSLQKFWETTRLGQEFSIPLVWKLFVDQSERCALTGNCFELPSTEKVDPKYYHCKYLIDPWAPSIDQIIPSHGYKEGNMRWVCQLVNIMKREIPDPLFFNLCQSISIKNKEDNLLI